MAKPYLCGNLPSNANHGAIVRRGERYFRICRNLSASDDGFEDQYRRKAFGALPFDPLKSDGQMVNTVAFTYIPGTDYQTAHKNVLRGFVLDGVHMLEDAVYSVGKLAPTNSGETWQVLVFDHHPTPDAPGLPAHIITCNRPVATVGTREVCHIRMSHPGGTISQYIRRPCPICSTPQIDRAWFPHWAHSLHQMALQLDVTDRLDQFRGRVPVLD